MIGLWDSLVRGMATVWDRLVQVLSPATQIQRLYHQLQDGGRSNTALLTLMKSIETEIAMRKEEPVPEYESMLLSCYETSVRYEEYEGMKQELRETLGKAVRQEWIAWAKEQPDPKASWLVPWEDMDEQDKEADRRIGEAVVHHLAEVIAAPLVNILFSEDEFRNVLRSL